ncbi:MAG: DNA repair protein RecO C-terminal domain-containing protein [Gammaproteobacteria bacterium]|nr:DNA repair protein RecO C-terminal domain-containing protein [Gammaproteobacteria bacterium]
MTTKSLQAWVIHKQWSGDTSARVDFFSRELGLVHCLCKGGRTPKKQSLLQAFTPLWVCVDERHDRYYTQSMESISPMLHLEGNSLFSGLYINELLYHALRPIYPDAELFNAYLITLNGLASTGDRFTIESVLRRFEWTLLKACGHSFSWAIDARTGLGVIAEHYYQFVAGEGFVFSNKGIPGEHLLALAEDNLNETAYLKSAKIVMRQAIDHLLGGRQIKARSLYIH